MRYFLQAVETETGLPFEQELKDQTQYEQLKRQLQAEGYSDFALDERWSDLAEMYSTLEQEGADE